MPRAVAQILGVPSAVSERFQGLRICVHDKTQDARVLVLSFARVLRKLLLGRIATLGNREAVPSAVVFAAVLMSARMAVSA
jgi:hypothetical protein